jgi:hypothetical protein
MSWPWNWYGTGPAITESEYTRRQAEAAARGEMELIDTRVIPDREPEAGS